MKAANPYLNFPGSTREAFEFYRSVFGGDFLAAVRFRDFGDNRMGVPENQLDRIAHIALPLGGGNILMGTDTVDGQQSLKAGNNFSIALEAETEQEAERVFEGLSAAGKTEMPLQRTEWAEKYGMCTDRFGIQWMVSYTGNVRFLVESSG
jgi:PhnB protein